MSLYRELAQSVRHIKSSRVLRLDASWLLAGNVLTVLAGVAVIKLTTLLVPAVEFGRAGLVLGITGLLTLFLLNPLLSVHLRLYFDHLQQRRAKSYSKRFTVILFWAGVAATAIYVIIALIYRRGGTELYIELLVPAALLLITQPYFVTTSNYIEAHREYKKLAILNLLLKSGQAPFLLLLLVFAPLSAASDILLSSLLATVLVIACFRRGSADSDEGEPDPVISTASNANLSFGAWLYLGNLFAWVLSTSDRYVLKHFLRIDDVGIYIMNYSVWTSPYLLLNGWLESVIRARIYHFSAAHDWQSIARVFRIRWILGLLLSVLATIMLYWLGPLLGRLLLGEHYWVGRRLMLILGAAHIFFVLGNSTVSPYIAAKRTHVLAIAYFFAGVTNFLLNIFLIPHFGILAAATSTLAAYILWAAILMLSIQFLFKEKMGEGVPLMATN